jgi:hypothetical protein
MKPFLLANFNAHAQCFSNVANTNLRTEKDSLKKRTEHTWRVVQEDTPLLRALQLAPCPDLAGDPFHSFRVLMRRSSEPLPKTQHHRPGEVDLGLLA